MHGMRNNFRTAHFIVKISLPFQKSFSKQEDSGGWETLHLETGLVVFSDDAANLQLAALGLSSSNSLRMRRNSPSVIPAPSLSKTRKLSRILPDGRRYPWWRRPWCAASPSRIRPSWELSTQEGSPWWTHTRFGKCCFREIRKTCEAQLWAGLTYITILCLNKCWRIFTFLLLNFLRMVHARVYRTSGVIFFIDYCTAIRDT